VIGLYVFSDKEADRTLFAFSLRAPPSQILSTQLCSKIVCHESLYFVAKYHIKCWT